MKSLLLIGATLMAGAGIYGFVDYKKKEQSSAFKTLYKEEKPVVQQPTPEIFFSPAPVVAEATMDEEKVVKTKKGANKKGKHKQVRYTQFSRAIPREGDIEEMVEEDPEPPLKKIE
jgi:hypothetical protein